MDGSKPKVKNGDFVMTKSIRDMTEDELCRLKVRERTALFKADGVESIEEFCDYIIAGGHLCGYCRERGLKYIEISGHIELNKEYSAMYARAKRYRADTLADELVSISDELDVKASYKDGEVTLALDATAIARNRLRVETRKWVASKLRPDVYGDKVIQEITGAHGGPIIISPAALKGLSDSELSSMQKLLEKASRSESVIDTIAIEKK